MGINERHDTCEAVHLGLTLFPKRDSRRDSSQAPRRHTRESYLPLLPSGPGGVRKSLLRRTQLSTPLHVRQTLQKSIAAHEEFSPAIADCG